MRHLLIPFGAALLTVLLSSCNPDCDPIPGLQAFPPENPPGYEILITANDPSVLEEADVFFGEKRIVDKEFDKNFGIKIVVPDDVNGPANIRIEDGDCVYYPDSDFQVVGEDFFINNPNFISPVPPQIIFPTPPTVFPPSIDNAWINPENPDYCIWFIMEKIVTPEGDTVTYVNSEGKTVPFELPRINPNESFEFSTCFREDPSSDLLYKKNPISGIIDTAANYISLRIDRTHIGQDVEEYVGEFILVPDTYADFERAFPADCAPQGFKRGRNMIFLRSLKTGRHFVVFQPSS